MLEHVLPVIFFVVGLVLVVYSAEKLVEGTVGVSLGFGVSAFVVSTIFIGFDPENLFVGASASHDLLPGIALGTVLGSSMVAVAFALGTTLLFVDLNFEEVHPVVPFVAPAATVLLLLLSLDGLLSRLDGFILLVGYGISVLGIYRLGREGSPLDPGGEVSESLEEASEMSRLRSAILFAGSLTALFVGSELLVRGSEGLISILGITETAWGMTILAFLVSVEEIARELPAALEGRPDISIGNVVGSALAFFLFNAGAIAVIAPVPVPSQVLSFHFPLVLLTVLVISAFLHVASVPRWASAVFLGLYSVFAVGAYVI